MRNTTAINTRPRQIFNRRLLNFRKERRGHASISSSPLRNLVDDLLEERLSFVKRSFENILIIGDCELVICPSGSIVRVGNDLKADGEFLPFDESSFDLVINYLDLHYHNDVPGSLRQINHILKPDGLFLGVFLGGESLWQLRLAVQEAEEKLRGGVSPRVAPMISLHDAAALLQRAQFALPVADHELITHTYPSMLEMLQDLKALGLTNVHTDQHKGMLTPAFIEEIANCYPRTKGVDGFPLTFDVVFLSGWAPCASQPKALRPGSGQIHLSHVL